MKKYGIALVLIFALGVFANELPTTAPTFGGGFKINQVNRITANGASQLPPVQPSPPVTIGAIFAFVGNGQFRVPIVCNGECPSPMTFWVDGLKTGDRELLTSGDYREDPLRGGPGSLILPSPGDHEITIEYPNGKVRGTYTVPACPEITVNMEIETTQSTAFPKAVPLAPVEWVDMARSYFVYAASYNLSDVDKYDPSDASTWTRNLNKVPAVYSRIHGGIVPMDSIPFRMNSAGRMAFVATSRCGAAKKLAVADFRMQPWPTPDTGELSDTPEIGVGPIQFAKDVWGGPMVYQPVKTNNMHGYWYPYAYGRQNNCNTPGWICWRHDSFGWESHVFTKGGEWTRPSSILWTYQGFTYTVYTQLVVYDPSAYWGYRVIVTELSGIQGVMPFPWDKKG